MLWLIRVINHHSAEHSQAQWIHIVRYTLTPPDSDSLSRGNTRDSTHRIMVYKTPKYSLYIVPHPPRTASPPFLPLRLQFTSQPTLIVLAVTGWSPLCVCSCFMFSLSKVFVCWLCSLVWLLAHLLFCLFVLSTLSHACLFVRLFV